jgi:hypothetical protein
MTLESGNQNHPKKKKGMKLVGGRNLPSFWERFDRLQRTTHLLFGRSVSPKGVFRFKSFEEFEEWKQQFRLQEVPNKTT